MHITMGDVQRLGVGISFQGKDSKLCAIDVHGTGLTFYGDVDTMEKTLLEILKDVSVHKHIIKQITDHGLEIFTLFAGAEKLWSRTFFLHNKENFSDGGDGLSIEHVRKLNLDGKFGMITSIYDTDGGSEGETVVVNLEYFDTFVPAPAKRDDYDDVEIEKQRGVGYLVVPIHAIDGWDIFWKKFQKLKKKGHIGDYLLHISFDAETAHFSFDFAPEDMQQQLNPQGPIMTSEDATKFMHSPIFRPDSKNNDGVEEA